MPIKFAPANNELGIEHIRSEFGHVTASIGLANRVPEEESEAGTVIKAPDEVLYDAKVAGRNRIAPFQTLR